MDLLAIKRSLMPLSGPQDTGGGGGGSSTGGGTTIQELPEWARGYAKNTLEKGAALTETPYQTYNQPRIAGFSPLQQQAQQGAANMQTSGATGAGIDVAGAAALGGLNQNYQGIQAGAQNFGGRQAAQYMSPFIEQAMAPQLREAQRASDIQAQQNAARAVGQGAFGGSRSALVEAERQRNLGTQLGDIQAKGFQTAYEQAQNQFNADQARQLQAQQMNIGQQQFGANLGLQGLNTALQGAGQLGALGQQQFQQGMDINKLQSAYGGQQQALRQQGLDQAYQDFMNQQNYPYKQLGFMSDLIRGLPVGQATTKSIYEPAPSMAQQVGSIGLGAYGLSKFMAEGGMAYANGGAVEGYKFGGDVDSRENVEDIVHSLRGNPEALQRAYQAAKIRGDVDQIEAIEKEMAITASLRNGIAGGITNEMAERFAGGGILAFAARGAVDSDEESDSRDRYVESKGDPAVYGAFGKYGLDQLKRLNELKSYEALTPEQRAALDKSNYERIQAFGGEDPYAPMAERIKGFYSDLADQRERGKGAVALQMAKTILRPGSKSRAVGETFGTMGEGLSALDAAQAREKRALAGTEFNLADAQRKERMATGREAIGATKDIEANRLAAHAAERADIVAGITGAGKFAQAYRPVGGGGGAGKGPKVNEQLAAAEVAYANDPSDANLKQVKALRLAVDRIRTSESGPGKLAATNEANEIKRTKMYEEALGDLRITPAYKKANPAQQKALEAETRARVMKQPLPSDNAIPVKNDYSHLWTNPNE